MVVVLTGPGPLWADGWAMAQPAFLWDAPAHAKEHNQSGVSSGPTSTTQEKHTSSRHLSQGCISSDVRRLPQTLQLASLRILLRTLDSLMKFLQMPARTRLHRVLATSNPTVLLQTVQP